jgi:hypothetical protein
VIQELLRDPNGVLRDSVGWAMAHWSPDARWEALEARRLALQAEFERNQEIIDVLITIQIWLWGVLVLCKLMEFALALYKFKRRRREC